MKHLMFPASHTLATLFITFLGQNVDSFYLPGVAPRDYHFNETINVKVIKLDSIKTQLPYDYYSLPLCRPPVVVEAAENLGEVLSGDKIETSAYSVNMLVDQYCKVVCRKEFTKEELQKLSSSIEDEYRVNWLLDNLPAATKYLSQSTTTDNSNSQIVERYEKGFALGFVGSELYPGSTLGIKYIYNHLLLNVFYHHEAQKSDNQAVRVVGFEVQTYSVKHKLEDNYKWNEPNTQDPIEWDRIQQSNSDHITTCFHVAKNDENGTNNNGEPKLIEPVKSDFQKVGIDQGDDTIIFTYDVKWHLRPDVRWASRWDVYLQMTDSKIHWFSIINSIMIVLFLSGLVAVIMMRILHRDLTRYNSEELSEEEEREERGWKLVSGDVFRPPSHGGWFAVFVGSGVQIFAMSIFTLLFAALGFLSPANRGALMSALLFLFVFSGTFAGYYSTRIYKMFNLSEWKQNTLLTALFFPGVAFGVFFILNLFVWDQKSSGAVPFGTLVALLVLWIGISCPLVYLGSYIAFKKPAHEHPVKINNIARLLPEELPNWYTSPKISIMLGGILPFAACFIEIFFIMSSIWQNKFYYMFSFLFIVFIILIITCAEITIVLTYFQLCNEDWHWWWRSFLTPGSSAVYLFLYSILYFFTKLEIIKFVSGLLFFGYMALISLGFFLLTGTIGYFATFAFITKIYASIKID